MEQSLGKAHHTVRRQVMGRRALSRAWGTSLLLLCWPLLLEGQRIARAQSAATVHRAASVDAPVVARLASGDTVEVLSEVALNGLLQVRTADAVLGWVQQPLLVLLNDGQPMAL